MAKIYQNAQISDDNALPIATAHSLEAELALIEKAHQEGYAQGLIDAEKAQLAQIKTLESLIQNIPTAIQAHRLSMQSEIADIVLTLTQELFLLKPMDINTLKKQIESLLTNLSEHERLTLLLHPSDFAAFSTLQFTTHPNLKLTIDETLTLGGFKLKTEHGMFEASIERQIDKLKERIYHLKHGATHE